jgi:hypothetical protein
MSPEMKASRMKPVNFLRYIVLPAAAVAAGVKLGIKYSQGHYVSKDRKFIEAEIMKREKKNNV